MKAKKYLFNGFITFGFLGAIACYFIPFFKLSGILGMIDSAFFEDASASSMLDIFLYTLKLNDQDEQLVLFVFLAVVVVLPIFLGLISSLMGFLLKPKFGGVVNILAGGYGLITHVIIRVILSIDFIDMGFISENMVSLDQFVEYSIGAYINLFFYIVCIVLAIVMMLVCKDEPETTVVANNNAVPFNNYGQTPVYQENMENYNYGVPANNYDERTVNEVSDDQVTVQLAHSGFSEQFVPLKGRIVGIAGEYRGAEISVNDNETIYIGRDPERCNIVLSQRNTFVGRTHCSIQYYADMKKYKLSVFSMNGVLLHDGRQVVQGEKILVSAGTRISLANQENVFDLK